MSLPSCPPELWPEFSRLLDLALELPPAERAGWLDRLPTEHVQVLPWLRRILVGSAPVTKDFLDAPQLHLATIPDEFGAGSAIGPYAVIGELGRGGMSAVYSAERVGGVAGLRVALKVIKRGMDSDEILRRFRREREILAALKHPNITHLIDGGITQTGRAWFAMELVDGMPITQWCDAQHATIAARIELFLSVCAAVQHAHRNLVVHRDLKPGNILVDTGNQVKLLDFGIAKLLKVDTSTEQTQSQIKLLTPEYAAPEQLNNQTITTATDVYQLGLVLHELLCGRRAKAGTMIVQRRESAWLTVDVASIATARRASVQALQKSLRGDLERIVQKTLSEESHRRYESVAALADDLQRYLQGQPVRAAGESRLYKIGKFIRRNRIVVALSATLGIALLLTAAFAIQSAWQERIERDSALAEVQRGDAVREYIMLMFGTAGARHDAANFSAHTVLEQSAKELFVRFKDKPDVGARVGLALSQLYLELGDSVGARPLLEDIINLPNVDAQPNVLAEARLKLAIAEYALGNVPHAQSLLDQAQSYWRTEPQRFQMELNDSRVVEAQMLNDGGEPEQAIAILKRAIDERRMLPNGIDYQQTFALGRLSLILMDLGRYDEAIERITESYHVFEKLNQIDSIPALALIGYRAKAELSLGKLQAAEADARDAADRLRSQHGESSQLAAAERILGTALSLQQRHVDAIAMLEDALRIGVMQQGEAGRDPLLTRVALAEAYVAAGYGAKALPVAETALQIAREHFAANNSFAGTAYRARAGANFAQGRLPQARSDLETATAIFNGMGARREGYLKSLTPLREKIPGDDR